MRDQTWRRTRQFVFANRRNNGSTCRKPFKKRLRCLAHARDCGEGGLGKGRKRKISERRSQCNMCSFEATTRLRLRAHRQAEHGGLLRKHRCTRCCAQFASSRSYVRHVRRHASKVAFPCPTIGSGLPMNLQGPGINCKAAAIGRFPSPLYQWEASIFSPNSFNWSPNTTYLPISLFLSLE